MTPKPGYGCREDRPPPVGPLAADLTRATTFAKESAESLRAVGAGEIDGEFYPRCGHPVGRRFESGVAELEQTDGAVAFASGVAALYAIFAAVPDPGDTIAMSRDLYGGTVDIARHDLPRLQLTARKFDPFRPESFAEAFRGVSLVHVETPTNPLARVVDIDAVVRAAREAGALVSVDATFQPPPLQQPATLGVDLVMHSATKFLGGHSDALGGVVSGPHALMEKLEAFRHRTGAVLSPDTAWLLVRSLGTLELRAREQAETAQRLALALDALRATGSANRGVRTVHYPGLPEHEDHALARRQMATFGSMLAFEVEGGLPAAAAVIDGFQVIARAVSLGGIETLASLPLHTSHAPLTESERNAAGIDDGLIRLSVGLEPFDRLEADLLQALS